MVVPIINAAWRVPFDAKVIPAFAHVRRLPNKAEIHGIELGKGENTFNREMKMLQF